MFFFQTFMTNFVLTKSSGSKSHAVAFTVLISAGFYVLHRSQCGAGGEKELAYSIDLSWPDMILPTLLNVWQPSVMGVGSFTHQPCRRICPHP